MAVITSTVTVFMSDTVLFDNIHLSGPIIFYTWDKNRRPTILTQLFSSSLFINTVGHSRNSQYSRHWPVERKNHGSVFREKGIGFRISRGVAYPGITECGSAHWQLVPNVGLPRRLQWVLPPIIPCAMAQNKLLRFKRPSVITFIPGPCSR